MAKGSPSTAGAAELRARASARYVRMAPMKVRRVVDLIRGLEAAEALSVLQFAPQAASEPVAKVLASAVANAEHNLQLDPESLIVSTAYVDEGPTLKRFRPRAQGRAYRINKRTSHITIEVESVAPVTQGKPAKAAATKGTAAKATATKATATKGTAAKATRTAKATKAAKATKSQPATAEPASEEPASAVTDPVVTSVESVTPVESADAPQATSTSTAAGTDSDNTEEGTR